MSGSGNFGNDVTIAVGADPSAITATVPIGAITAIDFNPSRDKQDFSSNDDPDIVRRFRAGLVDPGDLSVTINWSPETATHDTLMAMMLEEDDRLCVVTFQQITPAATWTGRVQVIGLSPSIQRGQKMEASVVFAITDGIGTWA